MRIRMPRDDFYYEQVKKALIKAGWQVSDKPLMVDFAGLALKIVIEAEKDGQRIAVEVKSFLATPAPMNCIKPGDNMPTIGMRWHFAT